MGNQEAFYVAWGKGINQAIDSCRSLKRHNSNLKTVIVCFEELPRTPFDHIYRLCDEHRAKLSSDKFERKVEMIEYYLDATEALRVLFLDADTIICGCVQPIFDALDYSDLAMAITQAAMKNKGVPDSIATHNTGVIGFGAGSFSIVKDWLKYTYDEADDQHAMRTLLHYSSIKVATLLPRYNFRPKFPVYLNGRPIVVHTHSGKANALTKLGKGLWKGA